MEQPPMTGPDNYDPVQRKPLTAEQKQELALQRKADAQVAMRDYRADEQEVRDRTGKLRAERLERERASSAVAMQTHSRRAGSGESGPSKRHIGKKR
jgi:hypothetical protein